MTDRGFIVLARGMLDHPRFKPKGPFSAAEAWIWLLQHAAFKPLTVPIDNGRTRRHVQIERGQCTYSIDYLARAWRWGDKRVQRFLRVLQDDGSVTTQTTAGQTVITVCNYDVYQFPTGDETTQATTQKTGQSPTQSPTQTTTNKKDLKEGKQSISADSSDKRGRDGKSPPAARPKAAKVNGWPGDAFDQWYAVYPRRAKPKDARRAFQQTQTAGEVGFDELMAATKTFAARSLARPKAEHRFIPYPASWLRGGSWADEAEHEEPTSAPRSSPDSDTPESWSFRVAQHHHHARWLAEVWGPPPTDPACKAPPSILEAYGYRQPETRVA